MLRCSGEFRNRLWSHIGTNMRDKDILLCNHLDMTEIGGYFLFSYRSAVDEKRKHPLKSNLDFQCPLTSLIQIIMCATDHSMLESEIKIRGLQVGQH